MSYAISSLDPYSTRCRAQQSAFPIPDCLLKVVRSRAMGMLFYGRRVLIQETRTRSSLQVALEKYAQQALSNDTYRDFRGQ